MTIKKVQFSNGIQVRTLEDDGYDRTSCAPARLCHMDVLEIVNMKRIAMNGGLVSGTCYNRPVLPPKPCILRTRTRFVFQKSISNLCQRLENLDVVEETQEYADLDKHPLCYL